MHLRCFLLCCRRAGLVAVALALQPGLAAQAADFIAGTYSTESGCQAQGQKDMRGAFLYLTAKGITVGELRCDFLSVASRSEKPGWVATTLCEGPAISYPELVSVVPLNDGRLRVAASQIADVDLAGDYRQCGKSTQ